MKWEGGGPKRRLRRKGSWTAIRNTMGPPSRRDGNNAMDGRTNGRRGGGVSVEDHQRRNTNSTLPEHVANIPVASLPGQRESPERTATAASRTHDARSEEPYSGSATEHSEVTGESGDQELARAKAEKLAHYRAAREDAEKEKRAQICDIGKNMIKGMLTELREYHVKKKDSNFVRANFVQENLLTLDVMPETGWRNAKGDPIRVVSCGEGIAGMIPYSIVGDGEDTYFTCGRLVSKNKKYFSMFLLYVSTRMQKINVPSLEVFKDHIVDFGQALLHGSGLNESSHTMITYPWWSPPGLYERDWEKDMADEDDDAE